MVDLVLPRMRFFCMQFNHYLNVRETARDGSVIDTRRVAIDACPRAGHELSPVEQRPTDPLQPEEVRVRYFIGLSQPLVDQTDPNAPLPGSPADRTNPHYANGFLFKNSALASDNMYVLYRVEFDPNVNSPTGLPTRNWLVNGRPNPNFFYDAAFAPEWKSRAVALVTGQDTDLVRLVFDGTNWRPEPTLRFGASPVGSESLDANTKTGTYEFAGIEGAPRPPTQYSADFGNWSGPSADMSVPLTESVIMSPQPAPPGTAPALAQLFVIGPRIQVFEQARIGQRGDRLDLVFDSGVPATVEARQRLFTWDSRRGIVNFALRRIQFPPPLNSDAETFGATVSPEYKVDLKEDLATAQVTAFTGLPETVPTGFGSLKRHAFLGRTVRIVPGSEAITRVVDTINVRSMLMERAGFTGLGVAGGDQFVAQADLQPNQYTIDYETGVITFSDKDPTLLQARPNGPQEVLVRYQFQTNRATDIVRATYATRELTTVQLGLVQYEPRSGDPQSLQLTNRVRVRNVGR
jgi:hypothetical protein